MHSASVYGVCFDTCGHPVYKFCKRVPLKGFIGGAMTPIIPLRGGPFIAVISRRCFEGRGRGSLNLTPALKSVFQIWLLGVGSGGNEDESPTKKVMAD